MRIYDYPNGCLDTDAVRRHARIVIAGVAIIALGGCHLPSSTHLRDATDNGPGQREVAIVRPQQDAQIGVSIITFDGTHVDRYLGGWGVRPKIPEVGVEPGPHVFEVAYYDFRTRTAAPAALTVQLRAQSGHLYEIRVGQRAFLAKLLLVALRARDPTWTAWVEDKGYVRAANR